MNDYSDITPGKAASYDFAGCWTRMHPDDEYNTRDVVAAIYATRGNLTEMAKLLGRTRIAVRNWLDRHPEFERIVRNEVEKVLDDLEQKTFDAALAGDGQDRRFLLQTLGKNRGYSSRQQMTGVDDKPLVFERIERVIVDAPGEFDSDSPPD